MKDNFGTILTKDSDNLNESLLLEKKRQELITQGRKGANYAPSNQFRGKNRFERKKYSKVARNVSQFNDIDMNAFFKKDILTVGIRVQGETDYYIVKIKFNGVLRELQRYIKQNNNKFEYKVVLQALTRVFNTGDIYVNCTCLHPDTPIKLLDGTTPTVSEMKERFDKGEKLWVYSTDSNGDFKPGEVDKVWITNETDKFIKVTLDNGQSILTTPEHLYMLRDGSYACACDLQVGQSLMPMYFNDSKGYETVKLNSEVRGWKSVYKLVAECLKNDEIQNKLKDAVLDGSLDKLKYPVAIHHSDFNKRNNNPENLKVMTAKEHWDYHASLGWDSFSDETKNKIRKQSSEWLKSLNANPTEAMKQARIRNLKKGQQCNNSIERKVQQAELMQKTIKDYWNSMSEEDYILKCSQIGGQTKQAWEEGKFNTDKFKRASLKRGEFLHTSELEQLSAQGVKNYWNNISVEEKSYRDEISKRNLKKALSSIKGKKITQEHKDNIRKARLNESVEEKQERTRKIRIAKIKNVIQVMLDSKLPLTEEGYIQACNIIKKTNKHKTSPSYKTVFATIDEAITYYNINHKIVRIEQITLEKPIPVYDIKVKDWENFVVGQGVVLHNCPDFKYRFDFWSTVNNYNSGNPQNIPAKITNPNNTKGSGCKHVLLVLANVEWLLRVASVINNYVNYAETHLQKLYADYIFPQIYGVKYSKEVQLQLTDTDEVTSDKELIDIANRLGRNRGRFSSTYQPDRAKGRNAFKKQIGATMEPKGNTNSNSPQKEESGSNALKSGKNNNTTFNKRDNKKEDSIEPIDEK